MSKGVNATRVWEDGESPELVAAIDAWREVVGLANGQELRVNNDILQPHGKTMFKAMQAAIDAYHDWHQANAPEPEEETSFDRALKDAFNAGREKEAEDSYWRNWTDR